MTKNKIPLSELQEIVLWQKLNNQRLNLIRREKPIPEESFETLKKFCFTNYLFKKINKNPLMIEIPLSLITNFRDKFFITIGLKSWTDFIIGFIPNVYCLSIEKALADGLDSITKYMNTYNYKSEQSSGDDRDDDIQLYAFINEYLTAKEAAGVDLTSLVFEAHKWKLKALKKIMPYIDLGKNISTQDKQLFIDLRKNKEIDKINEFYKTIFCTKSNPHPTGNVVKWVKDMNKVQNVLSDKLQEANLKQTIQEFIVHELPTCKTEIALIRKYSKETRDRANVGISSKIAICDMNTFTFLKNPLPTV